MEMYILESLLIGLIMLVTTYTYQKKKYPSSLVKWRIQESNKIVILNITIYPYVFNTGNKFLNIIPFYTFVKPRLYDYLKNIEKGIIYYLETNKKVKKINLVVIVSFHKS